MLEFLYTIKSKGVIQMENAPAVKIDTQRNISHIEVDLSDIKSYINVIEDGNIDVIALERNLDLWYSHNKVNDVNDVATNLVHDLSLHKGTKDVTIHGNVFLTKVDDVTGESVPFTPEDIANINIAKTL